MIVRTAYWTGDLPPENADAFFGIMAEIKPFMCSMPGVRDVLVKRPFEIEDGPCAHFAELSVLFDDRQGLEQMLGSEERAEARRRFTALAPLFSGSVHHINFEMH